MIWVQVLKQVQISRQGNLVTYYPGDWVEIGNQLAMKFVDNGLVKIHDKTALVNMVDPTSGILIIPEDSTKNTYLNKLEIKTKVDREYHIPFSETMILENTYNRIRLSDVIAGFGLLKNFQIAVPLFSYDLLACHIGSELDQNLTNEILPDLRVPLYDVRLMFVRKCDETEMLFEIWNEEKRKANGEMVHSFMRTYYRVKPVLCALPCKF